MPRPDVAPVLVVEDDPDIRWLLRRRLARWPYEVIEAATGEAALELLRERRPRLVVLDIVLPGIDGWEVLRQMRADPDLVDVPVVVVSMIDDPGEDARPAVQGYLLKPFDSAEVNRVFDEAFEAGSSPSSPPDHLNGGL